jgi:hypothetical protein
MDFSIKALSPESARTGCVVLGGDPPAGSAYLPTERNPAVFDKLDNPGEDVVQSTEQFPKGTLDRRWSMLKAFDEEWVKSREDARVVFLA